MSVQGFVHKGGVLFQRVLLHGLDQVGVAVLAQSHLNLVPNLYIVGRALHLAVHADASQASLATVRRLMIRLTFRYLSSRILTSKKDRHPQDTDACT